ncbi:MAG: aminotransferase class V-fold PLP-dependent enzyme [Acidimicrobiales bacterium]
MTTRAEAVALDAADPLAGFRERFRIPDDSLVYLNGNSLGRLPHATVDRLHRVVEAEWATGLVRSWSTWVDDAARVGDLLGTSLLGARPGETLMADATTVNLFKLLWAAAADRPGALVVDPDEFPSDRFVAQAVASHLGRPLVHLPAGGLADVDVPVAVVARSVVDWRTGGIADVEAGTAAAHARGALVLWDCSHAVGSVPLDLPAIGADLAAGCSYKHLCGGPGAPAWLWVRQDLQGRLRQPVWGWWAQRGQFATGPAYDPVDGIGAWASGTPPVLALAAAEEGIRLVAEAGIDRIRARSQRLTAFALGLHDELLAGLATTWASPRQVERVGGHVAIRHDHAAATVLALRERGVVPDFRAPDLIRIGLHALTTRFTDVWDGLASLADVLATGSHAPFIETTARFT